MKGYTVFNVEHVDGLSAHYYAQPVNPLPLSERIDAAGAFMNATGATIEHGGNNALYAAAREMVQLPPSRFSRTRKVVTPPPCTRSPIG